MLTLEQIKRLIEQQEQLDADTLHLTANETPLSPLAQKTLSS